MSIIPFKMCCRKWIRPVWKIHAIEKRQLRKISSEVFSSCRHLVLSSHAGAEIDPKAGKNRPKPTSRPTRQAAVRSKERHKLVDASSNDEDDESTESKKKKKKDSSPPSKPVTPVVIPPPFIFDEEIGAVHTSPLEKKDKKRKWELPENITSAFQQIAGKYDE
jgi:hypothetical protein